MAKKNLEEAFGEDTFSYAGDPSNYSQYPPYVQIAKTSHTDMAPSSHNKAQAWIVALLKRWSSVFTVSNRTINTDETVTCTNDGDALRTEGSVTYRVTTFRIQIFRVETAPTIDPDDY